MWVHAGKIVRVGKAWTSVDGIQHPSNWNNWTDEEKAAAGLTNDTSLDPKPYDNRFYWGWNGDKTALIERSLADINEVDSEGNPILDEKGNQIITRGLKYNAIQQVKRTASDKLSQTDWYVTRKTEAGTAIPTAVSDYRTAVRAKSKTIEDAIAACDTLAKFIALYDVPVDSNGNPTGNAPINDWPEEI
jgi:hypothetical protein